MSRPLGFNRRNDPGVRGWLARWWYRHRSRVIGEQLEKRRRPR